MTYNSLSKQGADLECLWIVDTLSPSSRLWYLFTHFDPVCLTHILIYLYHMCFRFQRPNEFTIQLLHNLVIAKLMEIGATPGKTTPKPNKRSSCLTPQEVVIKKCKRSTRGIKNGLPCFSLFFSDCLPRRTFTT